MALDIDNVLNSILNVLRANTGTISTSLTTATLGSVDGNLWLIDNGTDLIYNLGQAGTVISSFSTPSSLPVGLTIADDGTLWLADNFTDLIYNLGQAGTVISSFTAPSGSPQGLAMGNDNTLWLVDEGTDLVYNLGLAGTIISSFTAPAGDSRGLTMDANDTLWLADNVTDLIYNLGQAGTIISSFSTPSSLPTGLTMANDGTLWLADATTDLIYNLGQAGTVISSFTTPSGSPQGLTIYNSKNIKLIKDGDPLTEAPITLDMYPAILVKLSQENEEFAQIGRRNNRHELIFDIFSILYSTEGGSTSEKDIRKMSQNIKKVLKDNITLSATASSSIPERVDYFLAGLEGTFLSCSQITFRTFHWST